MENVNYWRCTHNCRLEAVHNRFRALSEMIATKSYTKKGCRRIVFPTACSFLEKLSLNGNRLVVGPQFCLVTFGKVVHQLVVKVIEFRRHRWFDALVIHLTRPIDRFTKPS